MSKVVPATGPAVVDWANGEVAPPPPAEGGGGNVNASQGESRRLDGVELTTGLLMFIAWLLLMAGGITVGTQSYIDPIRNMTASGWPQVLGCLLVITACHTVTNTAMLCCVSAFLGMLGSRATIPNAAVAGTARRDDYLAAVTRGFFVFLIIQSGAVVLSDQAFTNLSLDKYIRLAGLCSLFSFTVGYNPEAFRQLIDRVAGNLESGANTK